MTEELCVRCNDSPCACLREQIDAEELAALDPRNYEPECTCMRVDVDLYDSRGCELCDQQSEWNRACKAMDREESNGRKVAESIEPVFSFERNFSDETPF